MVLIAKESVGTREHWDVRLTRGSQGEHELAWPECHLLAVAVYRDGPSAVRLVVGRAARFRRTPVVELHDLGVHLEPVGDLVLGGEHGPVIRKRKVGQVVVPDRVVQSEALVPLAPGVPGAFVALDDDRGDAELA
jgi:hypothetical protein